MSDLDRKEEQPVETAGGQEEARGGPGLGALLKAEREKRGLSLQQFSEMTRLRHHMIEALEAEAWDLLPPPVFVRGFVRSYTKALGLDEKKFLDLYDEIAPVEARTPKLVPRSSRRKRGPFFLSVILLLVLSVILYAWLGYRPEKEAPGPEDARPATLPEKVAEVPTAPVKSPEAATNEGEAAVAMEGAGGTPTPATAVSEGMGKKEEAAERLPSQEGGGTVREKEPQAPVQPATLPVEEKPYVLKGIVQERTWVKISVDGAEPKEYIFQPGSRPQWEARGGFEIMVGNAGGIEFEFDGEMVEGLGETGKVVRLRLPKGYQGTGGLD